MVRRPPPAGSTGASLLQATIERIAGSDPFVSSGVATCEVIQFRASQTADGFDAM